MSANGTAPPRLPLAGVRVADFSRVVAGPYGTHLLARMGADVIKVEGLAPLDHTREVGPYSDERRSINRSGYFSAVNAGKRSVSLDLHDPVHAAFAQEIALASEIVVESFRTGGADRFGIGWSVLSARKPSIVLSSCSGFGQAGEMRVHSAYMNTVAAFVGLTALTGEDGPQQMPLGATFSDLVSGTALACGSLLAYRRAQVTGRGRHVDLSMAEATMAMMGQHFMAYFADRSLPQRRGNRFTGTAPSNAYPCLGADKWIAISVSSEAEWANLTRAMGNPAWITEQRLASAAGRLANVQALDAAIAAWTRDFDNLELTHRLQRAGVSAVPSSDPEDLCRNPHFQARGALKVQESVLEPGRMMPNLPWHFVGQPELNRTIPPAPTLGQHNRAVLEELTSATPDQIAAIEQAAAAVAAAPGRGGPPAVSAGTATQQR